MALLGVKYIHIFECIYTTSQMNELQLRATMWMKFKTFMLQDSSKSKKET